MQSYAFHELTQFAKARVASRYYQDTMDALDAVIGKVFTELERARVYESTVTSWLFTYDGERIADAPKPSPTQVCTHCGGAMVDGMCDAPLSSAD